MSKDRGRGPRRERPPPNKRPTLTQLAAQSQEQEDNAYRCSNCGCRDWRGEGNSRVENTRHPRTSPGIRRKRICRRCGKVGFHTEEVFVPEGFRVEIVPEEPTDDE